MLIPPNGGPGPHEHAQIEDSFYVIDGEIEVRSEFGKYIATKGSFVNIPKGGVVHGFKTKQIKLPIFSVLSFRLVLMLFSKKLANRLNMASFFPRRRWILSR
ncbi:cupin domain-containing protein [Mucilaginibacter aquariorum]|uniref:Cupin domain-containing protein n=1 Tax=Mucilaginibacter aquariorum TaxID=2967225 RepID=A0ABT1T928_9SPHI|nr:cupin domain-containing protein [Mucilaginibacter aquariorum]MCQ6961121.1 cupin domain-containing protein [Mucilaginibacter aquariorum]